MIFMDLREIKEIIKADGGKFIIIEDDKPAFVIMSFEDFKKRLQMKENAATRGEIREVREAREEKESNREIPKELEDEPLKIEDIPF